MKLVRLTASASITYEFGTLKEWFEFVSQFVDEAEALEAIQSDLEGLEMDTPAEGGRAFVAVVDDVEVLETWDS
jgi:hypothetical protein